MGATWLNHLHVDIQENYSTPQYSTPQYRTPSANPTMKGMPEFIACWQRLRFWGCVPVRCVETHNLREPRVF